MSSWGSGVSVAQQFEDFATSAGAWATWTMGGGLDRTVLTGRMVTLAVTGMGWPTVGGSCLMKGEISSKK